MQLINFNDQLENAIKIARISRIANLTQLDYHQFPVYQCTRPYSRNMVTAQGKAFNHGHARIGAIMESLEAYHAETVAIDRYEKIVKMGNELNYDFRQITAAAWPDKAIRWVKAYDLIQNCTSYLPHTLVCMDFTTNYEEDISIQRNSNGYAGGRSKEQALHHALLEILERHILASYKASYVKLDSVLADLLQPYFNCLGQYKFKLGIFSYLNPFNLSTIKVNIQQPGHNYTHSGFACHPNKNIALLKAFAEAMQSRLTFIAGARDDIGYQHYQEPVEQIKTNTKFSLINWAQVTDCQQEYEVGTEAERVEFLVKVIKAHNISNLLWVDLTQEAIGIPFVFVWSPTFLFNIH